jgi:hypothetical protein
MMGAVSQAAFVGGFYKSGLFMVQRRLLQHLAAKPATTSPMERTRSSCQCPW